LVEGCQLKRQDLNWKKYDSTLNLLKERTFDEFFYFFRKKGDFFLTGHGFFIHKQNSFHDDRNQKVKVYELFIYTVFVSKSKVPFLPVEPERRHINDFLVVNGECCDS
jgi:hypothetical protein